MSATIRSWNACSRDLHSRANLTYWLSALLFGFLFVLLIIIMSWLLRTAALSFAGGPGAAFTVFGATPQRDAAAIGFSAQARIAQNTELYGRYDGEVGAGADNHAFTVGLRVTW